MQIDINTPRRPRTISGVSVQVPAPYLTGHVVTEAEASILNQTLAENISNNLRDKFVIAAVAATDTTPATPERTLSAAEAQALVDTYITEYTPGVRGAGNGAARVVDPIEKEARVFAQAKVLEVLTARGMKRSQVENFAELVDGAFEKRRDEYMAQGKAIVAAREKAATKLGGDTSDDFGLGEVKVKQAAAPAPAAA